MIDHKINYFEKIYVNEIPMQHFIGQVNRIDFDEIDISEVDDDNEIETLTD